MHNLTNSKASLDVLKERARQIHQEQYSTAHDDKYKGNELVRAGAGYANHVIARAWTYDESDPIRYQEEEAPDFWPWCDDSWKPTSPRQDLVKAAALLIAEIERIDRDSESN